MCDGRNPTFEGSGMPGYCVTGGKGARNHRGKQANNKHRGAFNHEHSGPRAHCTVCASECLRVVHAVKSFLTYVSYTGDLNHHTPSSELCTYSTVMGNYFSE